MDTSDWITALALVVAVVSMIVNGFQYETNRRMARANEMMEQHNQRMAQASEDAVQTDRRLFDLEQQKDRRGRKACLVIPRQRTDTGADENIVRLYPLTLGFAFREAQPLAFGVRNEGSAPAFEARITCSDTTIGEVEGFGDQNARIKPDEAVHFVLRRVRTFMEQAEIEVLCGLIGASLPQLDGRYDGSIEIPIQLRFRDHVGFDRLTIPLRLGMSRKSTDLTYWDIDASIDTRRLWYPPICQPSSAPMD